MAKAWLPVVLALGAVALLLATAFAPSVTMGPAAPAAPVDGTTEARGYVETRDGTLLAYHVVLPGDGAGRYPTLFEYSGYAPGYQVDAGYVERYAPKGYALVGVNVRGTGCSGGAFDFFEPKQAEDGFDVVEWIAQQPWSDGKVAMIGKSMPGITQLFVAAERPPHLVAAAPGHVYGDVYRDVAYPGGIFNYAFAGLWSFAAQPSPGSQAAAQRIREGDDVCARHVAARQQENAPKNAFVQAQQHRFDDAFLRERSPLFVAERIEVPLFLVQAWQDEQLGSRGLDITERLVAPYWLTVTNGDHSMYRTEASLERLDRFLDRFVKGVPNGFENEPRVVAWWDADVATRAPAWTTTHDAWPVAGVEPLRLHLRAGGRLAEAPPSSDEAPDAYAYPAGTTSNGAGYGYPWPAAQTTDALRLGAAARATYVTDPLARDVLVMGPANLTLWLSSTATDTDVQATLSEVRPDGKVVFVQKGWLRASHRALDAANSTPYRPYHPHTQEDPLAPGEPVELNVELFPMGHAFRAGSRIRIDVEAPSVPPELWGFAHLPVPAVNRVHHSAAQPSALTLPVLPGAAAGAPLPPCGSLVRQSCV